MKVYVINLDSRPERWEEFKRNNSDKIPYELERFSGIVAKPGDLGCAQSHIAIMKKQDKYPFAILEDDCVLLHAWDMVVRTMIQLPPNWDALWLGANLTRPLQRWSKNSFILKRAYTTHAIIYNTKKIPDFVIKNYNPKANDRTWILDVFYYQYVFNNFHCFITYPLCATQAEGYSDVADKKTDSWVIQESYEKFIYGKESARLR